MVATDFEYPEFLKAIETYMWYSNGFVVLLMSMDPVYLINTPGARKEIVESHSIVVAPYLSDVALTTNLTDWDKESLTVSLLSPVPGFSPLPGSVQ